MDYTLNSPRKVTDDHGHQGREGPRRGHRRDDRRDQGEVPEREVDHSTDQVFQLTLVDHARRANGGRIMFGVSTQTHRTTIIGVPGIAFCE